MPDIIYQPQAVFNLRETLETAALRWAVQSAATLTIGAGEPWSYYIGLAVGHAAAATSIPGFAATLYVVGDTFDALFFKSPDGSEVRWFLNGVAQTSIFTFASAATWERLTFAGLIPGVANRIDFELVGPDPDQDATGLPVFGLGPVFVQSPAYVQSGEFSMATVVSFRLRDSETDTSTGSVPVYLPDGMTIAEMQAWINNMIPLLEAMTDCAIDSIEATIAMSTASVTQTTPVGTVYNERGGLISFDTTGPRRESVRVPGIKTTIMSGEEFSLTDTAVANFIAAFTTGLSDGAATVQPETPYGYVFQTARRGVKSGRKF